MSHKQTTTIGSPQKALGEYLLPIVPDDRLQTQLLELLRIENNHDRETAVLLWWDQLSTIEQECVCDEIIMPTITHIRQIWDEELLPALQMWGEFTVSFLDDLNAAIREIPELVCYIERLKENK